jgi:hypothetical protein
MKKEVEFQKCFDVVSSVRYIGIEDDLYMFNINRHFADLVWDDEDDEVAASFVDGEVFLEAYHNCSEEEEKAIEAMVLEIVRGSL